MTTILMAHTMLACHREVELAVAGTAAGEGTTSCDPVMADIHADFTRCMDQFCRGTKVRSKKKKNIQNTLHL